MLIKNKWNNEKNIIEHNIYFQNNINSGTAGGGGGGRKFRKKKI